MRLNTLLCGLGVLSLVACGASDRSSTASASSKTTARSHATTAPSTSASVPKKSASADVAGLTGFGATRESWDQHHQPAPGFSPGSAFLPLVRGGQPKYASVNGEPGERIMSYGIYFPEGTNLALAKRIALQEFPRGAKYGVLDNDEAHCLIAEVRSPPVERALGLGYRPIVGFFTDSAVSETLVEDHVDYASMLIASPDEKTDLGMC